MSPTQHKKLVKTNVLIRRRTMQGTVNNTTIFLTATFPLLLLKFMKVLCCLYFIY